MFSIETLWRLEIRGIEIRDSESVNAFCVGMETGSLEELAIGGVSFPLEHEKQVTTTLARSNNLVYLDYITGTSTSFIEAYCTALSNIFDTKLVRLLLVADGVRVDLRGDFGETSGIDTATEIKIRNLLKWNVQRTTCPPLFAAIGNAESDAKRKQSLVKAFEAVDIPVVFEYIMANENNLIELIQRLGRSRKRQRED